MLRYLVSVYSYIENCTYLTIFLGKNYNDDMLKDFVNVESWLLHTQLKVSNLIISTSLCKCLNIVNV